MFLEVMIGAGFDFSFFSRFFSCCLSKD